MAVNFDKNTDYKAVMNRAVEAGDLAAAAKAEQQRNAKLDYLNATGTNVYADGQKTYDYAQYLTEDEKAAPTAPNLNNYVSNYSDYIKEIYKAKQDAAVADIEAAYKSNVSNLDRTEAGLAESYQNARNQTAGASEQAKRNFAQYAAANGLNNGTGGQAELARSVTLQNNMNTINTQEAQSLADLQLQRANLETEYNNAIAQAKAEGNYELANALYEEKVRVDDSLMNAAVNMYQYEYKNYRDGVSDAQNAQSQKGTTTNMTLSTAKDLAKNGIITEESRAVLNDAGYSDDAIKAIYGIDVIVGGTPVSWNNGSLTPEEVREMQEYYGLDIDGYWGPNSQSTTGMSADDAWANYQSKIQPIATPSVPLDTDFGTGDYTNINAGLANSGLTRDEYDSQRRGGSATNWDLPSSVYEALGMGHPEKAVERLDAIWDTLSAAEQKKAQEILAKYGYQYTP